MELRARHAQMIEDERIYLEQQRQQHREEKQRKQVALHSMARRHELAQLRLEQARSSEREMRRSQLLAQEQELKQQSQQSQQQWQQHRQAQLDSQKAQALRLVEDLRARKLQADYYANERRQSAVAAPISSAAAPSPTSARRPGNLAQTLALVQSAKAKRIQQQQLQQQKTTLPQVR